MRRLILFDIDGTLVSGGPAKDAFLAAMVETYGTTGAVERLTFAGKTDPQIARELLTGAGFDDDAIDRGLARLWERYLLHLENGLPATPMRVLAGVHELLEALGRIEDVAVGLLTGNILDGARLKLGSAGLWEHFPVGGFGSDHEERDLLPAVALERARSAWGADLAPADAIVVGDTPRDVACGKAGGTRTLAVATGHFGLDELEACGPDHAVTDLSRTDVLVSLLTA